MSLIQKRPKYGNKKTVVDGITFSSRKEAAYYHRLKFMQSQGLIFNLKLQVKFDFLVNSAPLRYVDSNRVIKYVADFEYTTPIGERVVVDVKGFKTRDYLIKKALMMACHSVRIEEV